MRSCKWRVQNQFEALSPDLSGQASAFRKIPTGDMMVL